jgi:hypothetical protein
VLFLIVPLVMCNSDDQADAELGAHARTAAQPHEFSQNAAADGSFGDVISAAVAIIGYPADSGTIRR